MNTMSDARGIGSNAERAVFHRVLCGVDDSPEGLEAVRQADALQGERGQLTAIGALDLAVTVHAGWTYSMKHLAPSSWLGGGLPETRFLARSSSASTAPTSRQRPGPSRAAWLINSRSMPCL